MESGFGDRQHIPRFCFGAINLYKLLLI